MSCFTKEATRALGVDNLYALMHNAQGYAEGGVVGRAPMYGLSGGGLTVNVDAPVSVTQEGGTGRIIQAVRRLKASEIW
jgi:phage-related minor tail protein